MLSLCHRRGQVTVNRLLYFFTFVSFHSVPWIHYLPRLKIPKVFWMLTRFKIFQAWSLRSEMLVMQFCKWQNMMKSHSFWSSFDNIYLPPPITLTDAQLFTQWEQNTACEFEMQTTSLIWGQPVGRHKSKHVTEMFSISSDTWKYVHIVLSIFFCFMNEWNPFGASYISR